MRKLWKIYKYASITIITVLIIDASVVLFFGAYRPAPQKADAIVILGAAINTPALYNRSLEALRLYEEGKAPLMVLSGGRISDKDISEATYMQRSMQKNTSKPLNLILEDRSHSTYENIKNTREKIGSGKSLVIVSDEYHLARAVIMAKRIGFGPIYWSSPNPTYYKKSELAYYYMREIFAMIAYLPKFLLG
jgi:uncharacterized SAM-binding protein YcdF (DUF218 family)